MVKTLKGKTCKERLRSFDLFSLEKRRLRGDLIIAYNFLRRGQQGGGADLLSLVTSDRTRGNGMKLHQGKFRVDIMKRFFIDRVPDQHGKSEYVPQPNLDYTNYTTGKAILKRAMGLGWLQPMHPVLVTEDAKRCDGEHTIETSNGVTLVL
ncbi:hypothetical protein GRJ2_001729300 [Grus japonensis]|uniref:Uncharacterized protein n=1 Tax=Grus japonensis TaxID=30415 RepID=A0ABC9X4M8_GRUJA